MPSDAPHVSTDRTEVSPMISRLLAAAALGGAVAPAGRAAARTCRRKGEHCRQRSQCCGHQFGGRALACQSMEGCGLSRDRCCVRPGGPCSIGSCECCGTSYCGPEAVCV